MDWITTIGIETHVQLDTASKIFSDASTAYGVKPNSQASFVDLALPGTLPVLNRKAVECAIKFGIASGATIGQKSIFARKNYFYPDLPKGYQISQYQDPIVMGGGIKILCDGVEKLVRLTRAHLEEDAGKSIHDNHLSISGIDLNRAGTPLLEIVTEPDITSSTEAVAYAKTLHTLVTWIGICAGNLQEGNFRCDANVSVRPRHQNDLGTRREIKNLNSFRFLQAAIDYEVSWQIDQLESGKKIHQATVLYDSEKNETRLMRTKEDAQDYRYFSDPDLLPLEVDEDWIEEIKKSMPELPRVVLRRFLGKYKLDHSEASLLTSSREVSEYFESTLFLIKENPSEQKAEKLLANWILGELTAKLNKDEKKISDCPVTPAKLAVLIQRIMDKTISSSMAKKVFDELWTTRGDVDTIIESRGLQQISDDSKIHPFIKITVDKQTDLVKDYKAGKEKALNAMIGNVMKLTKGKANPAQVANLLKKELQKL